LTAAASDVWQTTHQRDREAELLFVGNQFHLAIGRYFEQPSQKAGFPKTLEDPLKNPRTPNTRRYLSKIYPTRSPADRVGTGQGANLGH